MAANDWSTATGSEVDQNEGRGGTQSGQTGTEGVLIIHSFVCLSLFLFFSFLFPFYFSSRNSWLWTNILGNSFAEWRSLFPALEAFLNLQLWRGQSNTSAKYTTLMLEVSFTGIWIPSSALCPTVTVYWLKIWVRTWTQCWMHLLDETPSRKEGVFYNRVC